MKVNIMKFKGREVEQVFSASTVEQAQKVDDALKSAPFDYTVGIGAAPRGALGTDWSKSTAEFVVAIEDSNTCREFLINSGFKDGIDKNPQRFKA